MNIPYEVQDWAFDNALWIFIGMVATVMILGPVWLAVQCRKNPVVKITLFQRCIISFFTGAISIIMFYGLYFVGAVLLLTIFSIVPHHAILKILIVAPIIIIFFIIYFFLLHAIVRKLMIFWNERAKEYDTYELPPIPSQADEAANTPPGLPLRQYASYKERIARFIKYPISLKTGWHLTVLCGLCTIIFYFCFTAQARRISMMALHQTNLNGIAKSMVLYESQYDTYPSDLGDLVNCGLSSAGMFRTDLSDRPECKPGDKLKAPSYVHCNALCSNAPKDTLWIWMDPEQYDSSKMPVALFNGEIILIKKKELPALIERSQKWLADRPTATLGK